MSNPSPRYISNLTRDTYALILAGGRGSRLHELTDWRAKPAYRLSTVKLCQLWNQANWCCHTIQISLLDSTPS